VADQPVQYQQFHFDSEGLKGLELEAFGTTDDGYDAVVLTGNIALTTDDVLALAATLQGLAVAITTAYIEVYGTEDLLQHLGQLEAEVTGQEPLPFPDTDELASRRRHPSAPAPDIEGRDV
jgi:hypothetical protein